MILTRQEATIITSSVQAGVAHAGGMSVWVCLIPSSDVRQKCSWPLLSFAGDCCEEWRENIWIKDIGKDFVGLGKTRPMRLMEEAKGLWGMTEKPF